MPLSSLRRKILVVLVAAALAVSAGMVLFAQTVVRGKLVGKLREKGVSIARRVAVDAVNPMITGRYFEIAMMFEDLEAAERDFVYAFAVDEEGRDVAHTFAGGVPAGLKRAHPADPRAPYSTREVATDRGRVMDIAVPLAAGAAGAIHVGFSEDAIRRDVNEVVLLITLFSLGALVLGGVGAVAFSGYVTGPLVRLADAAEAFGRGERRAPVDVRSRDEVGDLGRVFNAMVENRRKAEEERERLIAELQRTLGEVRTLRGFLPICSSCKKVRGDEGYWQQIEIYLREHAGTEVSHGLCPDCAKALYPEYWDRIRDATAPAPPPRPGT